MPNFEICSPPNVFEVLDGEAVILNLEEGIYYNLNETGPIIWKLLSDDVPSDQLTEAFLPEEGRDISGEIREK